MALGYAAIGVAYAVYIATVDASEPFGLLILAALLWPLALLQFLFTAVFCVGLGRSCL
jgi:hypothetical protein